MAPDLLHFNEERANGTKRLVVRTSHIAAIVQEPGSKVVTMHLSSGIVVETSSQTFDELLALLEWQKP